MPFCGADIRRCISGLIEFSVLKRYRFKRYHNSILYTFCQAFNNLFARTVYSTVCVYRINPDIMQPPAAPASITSGRRSILMPPIAYTGTGQAWQISRTNARPLPFKPFLHSVSKIVPRMICVAPYFTAISMSSIL